MNKSLFVGAALLVGGIFFANAARADDAFPLKDGDTWVMVGDSITAQHLHSDYFEAFCFARFPKWTIHFRNSGVGGDTITRAIARFDRDAALWKPTVVSVELGMNEASDSAEKYIGEMKELTQRIVALKARPVYFTSSPVNDGTVSANLTGYNKGLDNLATALGVFAGKEKAPFADQYHALLDLWGVNKQLELTQAFVVQAEGHATRKDVAKSELLQAWLDEYKKAGSPKASVNLTGDGVHPGPTGQVTMAAALLAALHAPGLVSSATVSADGKVGECVQCAVTELKAENGGVSFTRLDESLPMPIPADARGAITLMPAIGDLSKWMLTVTGLKAGVYDVSIDGVLVAKLSADALAKGENLGLLEKGPVADQCKQVLAEVHSKEGQVNLVRAEATRVAGDFASAAKSKEAADALEAKFAPLLKAVADADEKIHAASQPRPHVFVIAPAK